MTERRLNDAQRATQTPLGRVGQRLRDTRQERGEDLYDIADYLRIRPAYLFALEEGDLGAMPGKPYAYGFLRTYADYLGYDGHDLVAEVKGHEAARPAPVAAKPAKVFPAAPAPSGGPATGPAPLGNQQPGSRKSFDGGSRTLPGAPILAASVALIALAYGGWYMMQGSGASALERVTKLPGELGQYAVQLFEADGRGTAPPPGADDLAPPLPAATVPDAATVAAAVEAPVPAGAQDATGRDPAKPEATAATLFERFSISDPPAWSAPDPDATTAALEPPDAAVPAAPTPAEPPAARVILRALEPSWIQVKSETRDYVRTRTLEPGERFVLPDRGDLALWTGNAGGIEILFDGESLGTLGEPGAVMRDVPLAPEALERRRGG